MKILSYSVILKEENISDKIASSAKAGNFANRNVAVMNSIETLKGLTRIYPDNVYDKVDSKDVIPLTKNTKFDFFNNKGESYKFNGLQVANVIFDRNNFLKFLDKNNNPIIIVKIKNNIKEILNNTEYEIESGTKNDKKKIEELNNGKIKLSSSEIKSIPKTIK